MDDTGTPYALTTDGRIVHPEPYECIGLMAALLNTWDTDAHAPGYRVCRAGAPGYEPSQPRLKKPAVMVHETAGQPIELTTVFMDVDRVPHEPWPDGADGPTVRLHVERLAEMCPNAGVYATRAGLRLVWVLATPVPVASADAWLVGWHMALKQRGVDGSPEIELDPNTLQWTRCYRLPTVARDGAEPVRPAMALEALSAGRTLDPAKAVGWPSDAALWPQSDLTNTGYGATVGAAIAGASHLPPENPDAEGSKVQIMHWAMASASPAGRGYAALLEHGKPWAEHGARDATMVKIIGSLAMTLRHEATPERVYWMLRPSLDTMRASTPPTKITLLKLWQKCVEFTAIEGGRREEETKAERAREAGLMVTATNGAEYTVDDDGEMVPVPDAPAPEVLASDTMWFRHTDTGNAERLVRMYGKELRYVPEWERWLTWTGVVWASKGDEGVKHYTKLVARHISKEAKALETAAADATNAETAEIAEARTGKAKKWAHESEGAPRRNAMRAMATSEPGMAVEVSDLDQHPMLFNVQNGTIDLATGELREHRRTELLAQVSPVEFDKRATCPTWDAFLLDIMGDDAEMVAYLHRAIGYTLSGAQTDHAVFFCNGSGGNGKGVLFKVLEMVFGPDYHLATEPGLLIKTKQEAHLQNVAQLQRKRFAVVSELEAGCRFDEPKLKRLSGGDTINARLMHANSMNFEPTHHVWVMANDRPDIPGMGRSMWRRLHMVPFEQVYLKPHEMETEGHAYANPKREDPNLIGKLLVELPGILNRLVAGCIEQQRIGLKPPAAVRSAGDEYRSEQDVIANFIEQRCNVGPGFEVSVSDLYTAFVEWAAATGERVRMKKRGFGTELSKRKYEAGRGRERTRKGIALKGTVHRAGRWK